MVAEEDYQKYDFYSILEIDISSSPREVHSAYRKKSLIHHPDRGGSHEAQLLVNAAKDVLLNPLEREKYDRYYRAIHRREDFESPSSKKKKPRSSFDLIYDRINQYIQEEKTKINNKIKAEKKTVINIFEDEYISWKEQTKREYSVKAKKLVEKFQTKLQVRKRLIRIMVIGGELILAALLFSIVGYLIQAPSVSKILNGLFMILLVLVGIGGVLLSTTFWIRIDREFIQAKRGHTGPEIFAILEQSLRDEVFIKRGLKISYREKKWKDLIESYASRTTSQNYQEPLEDLEKERKEHLGIARALFDIVANASTFDTSEQQVAKRITVALFIMGYVPLEYDSKYRMLLFSDGVDQLLIRFRHRTGIPSNIAYVRRQVERMRRDSISRGFIFCTPGLSDNGKEFAEKNNIEWYSLETMNKWIDNVIAAGYAGPDYNLLEYLKHTYQFVRNISLRLPGKE
jgi:hypothetical protein